MKLSLSKRGDYGLRIVQYLATQEPGYKSTSAEFAENCAIPAGNVPTVVSLLSKARVLKCTPGPRGGCVLARPPEEISILEVIEILEGPLASPQCLLESRLCEDGSHCAVHYAWAEARAALAGALGAMSVADAATRRVEPGS